MAKKSINIDIQARYFTQVKQDSEIKCYWLVAHGYGQLAEYFIKHFQVLDDQHAVIAPEGLHRFYLKGTGGRVGASWMTKLERESDIVHYTSMLDQILEAEDVGEKTPIIAFGFSQGAATIGRWLVQTKYKPTCLVLWAGAWPHDMSIEHNFELLSDLKIFIVIGNSDQYLGEQGISKYLDVFGEANIDFELIRFDGDHRLDEETLKLLAQKVQ